MNYLGYTGVAIISFAAGIAFTFLAARRGWLAWTSRKYGYNKFRKGTCFTCGKKADKLFECHGWVFPASGRGVVFKEPALECSACWDNNKIQPKQKTKRTHK